IALLFSFTTLFRSLLVSDYSSILFDYIVTNNPIIFYAHDYKEYETERGFYIKPELLPGPSIFEIETLISEVQNIENNKMQYKEKYEKFKNTYAPHEDGK